MQLTASQKTALWSLAGLAGSLIIAWYFSKRQSLIRETTAADDAAPPPGDGSGNMYTFNVPPLQMPQLGIVIPPTPPPATGTGTGSGGCCVPCSSGAAASTDLLAQAIENSIQWVNVSQNTSSASVTSGVAPASPRPYEPLVLDRPGSPGIANPNPYLQQTDSIYAAAWQGAIDNWNAQYLNSAEHNANAAHKLNRPTTAWALAWIQQYLFLFGDNPNAGAAAPISIH